MFLFINNPQCIIIEFPKRNDSWVQRLLNNKADFKDHFEFYNIENFELEYLKFFKIIDKFNIVGSERLIYVLKNSSKN